MWIERVKARMAAEPVPEADKESEDNNDKMNAEDEETTPVDKEDEDEVTDEDAPVALVAPVKSKKFRLKYNWPVNHCKL